MKKFLIPAAICLQIGLVACNNSGESTTTTDSTATPMDSAASMPMDSSSTMPMDTAMADHAMAMLAGTKPDTTVEGSVHFTRDGSKVKMVLDITVAKKAGSSVAVHIHDMGSCGDMGEHAMGHWNPTGEAHGKWGSAQYHSGDFGNISLDKAGKGHLEVTSDRWTIGGGAKTNVLNHSIIVHSGKDDYTGTNGNSGSRIGCGVITKG